MPVHQSPKRAWNLTVILGRSEASPNSTKASLTRLWACKPPMQLHDTFSPERASMPIVCNLQSVRVQCIQYVRTISPPISAAAIGQSAAQSRLQSNKLAAEEACRDRPNQVAASPSRCKSFWGSYRPPVASVKVNSILEKRGPVVFLPMGSWERKLRFGNFCTSASCNGR